MTQRREVSLAAELARLGAGAVVVGSTARLLRTGTGEPRDLDVVVADDTVPRLVRALSLLGSEVDAGRLLRCRDVHVDTAWGPLDLFVAPRPTSTPVDVDGTVVAVHDGTWR